MNAADQRLTTSAATDATTDADDEAETVGQQVMARTLSRIRNMLIALGRDWEHCGKAACKRARRCRGFACEPECDDDAGDGAQFC